MQQPGIPVPASAQPQWQALRTFSGLLKALAWIAGILGGIVAILQIGIGLSSASSYYSSMNVGPLLLGALGTLIWTVVSVISLYGASELILLLIAIEYNTRKP